MYPKKKYEQVQEFFQQKIQSGEYHVGQYLPSEHTICSQFQATRTTVRKALDELLKQGYIEKEHGRGSRVVERRKSLGLPTLKGFTASTDHDVKTVVTHNSILGTWDSRITFDLSAEEKQSDCVYFQRVRYINGDPVVLENTWYAAHVLELIHTADFVEGSFFKTLSQRYHIEIMGVEQEIRAQPASEEVAEALSIAAGDAILYLSIRFRTSKPGLQLYGSWYCHTTSYPIVSSLFL